MVSRVLRVVITFEGAAQEDVEAAVIHAGIDTFESCPGPGERGWVALYIEPYLVNETLARLDVPRSGYDVQVEPAPEWPTFQGPAEPIFVAGFTIVPPWFEVQITGPRSIRLDPGLSFGIGTHPTTAMMLEWISELHPATFLDVGCGSGILSLAAELLGAKVTALDVDAEAVRAAAANKLRNEANVDLIHGPLEAIKSTFDCVAANLLAGIITDLWPQLMGAVAAGGSLVVSGILEDQEDEFLAAVGAKPAAIRRKEGWLAMQFARC